MTVTVSDFKGQPGPSYGKIEFTRQGDVAALDFENSRQHSISVRAGDFYITHSLLDMPGYLDWINLNLIGARNDPLIDSQNALPIGLVKWIRFELKSYSKVFFRDDIPSETQRIPTVYFRNMKTTRIVTSNSDQLILWPISDTNIQKSRVETLDLGESNFVDITRTQLDYNWFDGDQLTRYYVETDDANIVSVSYQFKERASFPGDVIESIRLMAEGTPGESTTVRIRALDAAGNEVVASVVVTII